MAKGTNPLPKDGSSSILQLVDWFYSLKSNICIIQQLIEL